MKIFKWFIAAFVLIVILCISAFILLSYLATSSQNINRYLDLAGNGDVVGIKVILDQGVNPNISNGDGISLLDFAAALNQIDVVKLLLERGATVDIRNTVYGSTPFMGASENSHLEVAKLLLSKGADPKATDKFSKNALMLISQSWDGKGCRIEAMEFLLSCGLDINAVDKSGNTALIWAAYGNNATALKWLIEKKADLNHVNKQNVTALDMAIKMNKPESIRILKEAGAKTRSMQK